MTSVDISAMFTQLLNNKMYTLAPSFVEIYLKNVMTKLCCYNQDNPISQRWSIMQNWLLATFPDFWRRE